MKLPNKINNILGFLVRYFKSHNLDWEDRSLILQANILMSSTLWRNRGERIDLTSKEFRVFSQWGDDGIIQYLIHELKIKNKFFI